MHEAVRRWRNANIAEYHPGTENFVTPGDPSIGLPSLCKHPLPENAAKQIARASAAQNFEGFCNDFSNFGQATRASKTAPFWDKCCNPYLLSAASGRQWPQARVAATRHEAWGTDNLCKLCMTAPGTQLHRLQWPTTTPNGGWPGPTDAIKKCLDKLRVSTRDLLLTRRIYLTNLPSTPDMADGEVHWVTALQPEFEQSDLVWYIDGSLIDSGHWSTARLGVGIAAGDPHGTVCAAAFARPPPWIRTIPAAEAWALWVVLDNTCARRAVITYCQGNFNALRNGRVWATGAARKAARIWANIFGKFEPPTGTDGLIWYPAHRTRADVGIRKKSGGTTISITDLRANALVDELAKHVASSHRTTPEVRGTVEQNRGIAI